MLMDLSGMSESRSPIPSVPLSTALLGLLPLLPPLVPFIGGVDDDCLTLALPRGGERDRERCGEDARCWRSIDLAIASMTATWSVAAESRGCTAAADSNQEIDRVGAAPPLLTCVRVCAARLWDAVSEMRLVRRHVRTCA